MKNLLDWSKAIGIVLILVFAIYTAWIAMLFTALIISVFVAKILVSGHEPYNDTE